MKRSYFKIKPRKPMKRTKLRKASKLPISRLQRQIWELCKQIIRAKHGNICYTCRQTNLSGSNWHTGHMWSKASLGANLKYDLRVLRPQCYNCNINRGGMGADFYRRMLNEIGQEEIAKLEADRQVSVKAYDHYIKTLEEYKELVKSLSNN
jgi:hypothetical protein